MVCSRLARECLAVVKTAADRDAGFGEFGFDAVAAEDAGVDH